MLAFDDSLEHEVWAMPIDDGAARIVFVLDVTHPDATRSTVPAHTATNTQVQT